MKGRRFLFDGVKLFRWKLTSEQEIKLLEGGKIIKFSAVCHFALRKYNCVQDILLFGQKLHYFHR